MQRKERRREKRKKYINIIIALIFLVIMILIQFEEYNEEKIDNKEVQYISKSLSLDNTTLKILTNEIEKNNLPIKSDEFVKSIQRDLVQETYKGYNVVAKLEIPKIELETFVLQEFSENSLNTSVTKFWGPNPNEVGNLCIAGHNFRKQNMFHNLKKLEPGDRIFLQDNYNGKVEYEVYEIYKVFPEDVSCLSQVTKGKREVTLITCTNDSKQRIIIKSREIL